MNHIGLALLALILFDFALVIAFYYLLAIYSGAQIGFYGFTFSGISNTIADIRAAVADNPFAMPVALLLEAAIGNTVPFLICAKNVDVSARQVFNKPKTSGLTTAIYCFAAVGVNIFGCLFVNIISQLFLRAGLKISGPTIVIPWDSPAAAALMIFAAVIAAPLSEEFIIRGVLLTVFRRFGNVFAVVASSLAWALLHGNLVQGVPVFLMGLVLGMLALKSESIIPTFIIHAVNNLISVLETSAAAQGNILFTVIVLFVNIMLILTAIILFAVFHDRFAFQNKGANGHGFAAFFTCIPMIIVIIICVAETVLAIKPV